MNYRIFSFTIIAAIFLLIGCKQKYTPKPRGYFRIDFPEKSYRKIDGNFPYSFEIPQYASVMPDSRNPGKHDWINVAVPASKAEIHISYYHLNHDQNLLAELAEESRSLVYKHTIKADAIDESLYFNHKAKVYGTVYSLKGNAASPMQFFLTDSTQHFLRGAFYIREVPNIDSLQPVIDFLTPDIIRMIETTTWR